MQGTHNGREAVGYSGPGRHLAHRVCAASATPRRRLFTLGGVKSGCSAAADAGSRAPGGGAVLAPPPRAHWLFPVTSRSAIKTAVRGSPRAVGARGRGLPGSWERGGLWVVGNSAMFYSGLLTEGGRKETDMREAASLRQQRRMKQAVQFIHKDSADLLPLDGLKKLGSSKDTVSPRGRAGLGIPARGGRSP